MGCRLFMLLGDDVIDLVGAPRGRLGEPAVFTAIWARPDVPLDSAFMGRLSPA